MKTKRRRNQGGHMLKAFILVPIYAAKANQPGQMVDGKPEAFFNLLDARCMEM